MIISPGISSEKVMIFYSQLKEDEESLHLQVSKVMIQLLVSTLFLLD